jgi:glycosyltransferase involved in cell wall biosynthesis
MTIGNDEMPIKYSIVIPTRNRLEYLPYAIRSVLDSCRVDIELIVSNNHSSDGTNEFLSGLSDPRLRVVTPSVSLPMAGHYEFAINEARGEWITILGDDDAVMPYIFDRLDSYIIENPLIDIISSIRSYYFWPGCEDIYGDSVVAYSSRQVATLRSTEQDLLSALKGFRSCFDMPQIYTTSMIKRSLYQEIKEKSGGCFYHSIIPDMYSVVALCLSRKRYLRVEEPLFWVGTSSKSLGRSDRIYRDAEQFDDNGLKEYPCVPRNISGDVSYAIHSGGFGAMYIYECLLQSPLNKNKHQENRIRSWVLAAVMCDLLKQKRTVTEKKLIIDAINNECHAYNLSMLWIKSLSIIFRGQHLAIWLQQIPKRVVRRLGIQSRVVDFYSTSRQRFPTIAEASGAVLNARTSNQVKSEW